MTYLNLLSKSKRQELNALRRGRAFAYVAGIAWLLTLALSGVFWFAAQTLAASYQELVTAYATEATPFYTAVRELNDTAAFIVTLDGRHWQPSALLLELAERRPAGVTFTVLQLVDSERTLQIRGTAADRAVLLELEKNLNESIYLTDVTLPLHTITQKTDVEFTLSATVNRDLLR